MNTITSKLGVSPANLFKSTKVLKATPQGRRLGYHAPEQVSNQEPPDSRPCVFTTTLLGGVKYSLDHDSVELRREAHRDGPARPAAPVSLTRTVTQADPGCLPATGPGDFKFKFTAVKNFKFCITFQGMRQCDCCGRRPLPLQPGPLAAGGTF